MRLSFITLLSIAIGLFFSCKENKQDSIDLRIALSNDANSLNPLHARGLTANYLSMQIFQTLAGIDYNHLDLVGMIAQNEPDIKQIDDSTWIYEFILRDGVRFSRDLPLTIEDILFSFKLVNLEGTSYPGASAYYGFIDRIEHSADTIRFFSSKTYFLNQYSCSDFYILPRKIYDKNNILAGYTLEQLRNFDGNDTLITSFLNQFNDKQFDKHTIVGSGAYQVKEWNENQNIVLEKKVDWWGTELNQVNSYFEAFPEAINYQIIPNKGTQIAAFNSGEIDLIMGVQSTELDQIKNEGYQVKSQLKHAFEFVGLNCKSDFFQKKEHRQWLASLIDKSLIFDNVFQSKGKIIDHPILDFDIESSNISDARISVDTAISLKLIYNSGDQNRKSMALILNQELKKHKIEIEMTGMERGEFFKALVAGEYDLFLGGTLNAPVPPDLYSTFHSDNIEGGRNYTNYSSETVDSLLTSIQLSTTSAQRTSLYQALINELAEDVPAIYLVQPTETFVYSKRIQSFKSSRYRPHFWAPSIEL